jgi:hypothetical protein
MDEARTSPHPPFVVKMDAGYEIEYRHVQHGMTVRALVAAPMKVSEGSFCQIPPHNRGLGTNFSGLPFDPFPANHTERQNRASDCNGFGLCQLEREVH